MASESSITKVTLAGATGNLGPAILDALLEAGFRVTVLTRHGSSRSQSLPSAVSVAPVDYDSPESLAGALQGQDAVVSTLASAALGAAQLRLVEAAVQARVKRFVPSEFGADTLNANVRAIPLFKPTLAVQAALRTAADDAAGGMSFTLVACGLFLDWAVERGFLLNLKETSITLYDGGDTVFSTTTLATVGRAIVGVLRNPEATRNRAVYVQDTATTLKQLLAMGKEATGSEDWKETVTPIQTVVDEAFTEMNKEAPNPRIFAMGFIKAVVFGKDYGCHFEKVDNELLGIKDKKHEEVQELINSMAK